MDDFEGIFDIIILGTGLTESIATAALSKAGFTAAVFEQYGPSWVRAQLSAPSSGNSCAAAPPRPARVFYEKNKLYYGFTNFSAHPVNGKEYPTSEHLFQTFKFMYSRPAIAEEIRTISEFSRDVFRQAGVYKVKQHPNWLKMNIEKMDIVIWHKIGEHEDLKKELLGTGDAELVEDSAEDTFWGIGKNQQGRNELERRWRD
ncbi:hypothetical protein B0H17DRAFT_1331053 [Mycena rosella]|uniref:NADAR domain-containing protein n=1 Tax=Mycena rosella TaxID=1033263 RepID=A0AAD7GHV0_MYCRO|nr:hypothetical protein B0H17DRAFT_1331053 [Mycena rosella]